MREYTEAEAKAVRRVITAMSEIGVTNAAALRQIAATGTITVSWETVDDGRTFEAIRTRITTPEHIPYSMSIAVPRIES